MVQWVNNDIIEKEVSTRWYRYVRDLFEYYIEKVH
ncbi:hypothetical protein F383_09855 [Gossypium arboreum]|uniref:Uncharacterized protein n=1 Tax=Gossypium arboreum TaxID=29729 RepID=A0A0B0NWU3_GOSAR|nr:hypothetical protein F383_09855 [Gossypium arboreum]